MSYDLKIREEAVREFSKAFVWYEKQKEGLGEQFEKAVKRKLDRICKNPYHYKNEYKQFHQALIDKFPFLIVYTVNDKRREIKVMAIFHTSRNPDTKFRK